MDLEFQQTEPGEKLYLDRKDQARKSRCAEKPPRGETVFGGIIECEESIQPRTKVRG